MIRRLLIGDTLAVFNKEAQDIGAETVANFEVVLQKVTAHVFPQRALSYQKRYMRRYMRKPRNLTTREFSVRVSELNSYLKSFPPFGNGQELSEEEILDLMEFAVPNAWQKNMVLQGFDPVIHTPSEFVAFCERHEFTEGTLHNSNTNGAKPKVSSKNGSTDGKSRAKPSAEASSNKRKSKEKWCDLHQTHGHDTSECKVVQAQISKMRQSWETVRPSKAMPDKNKDHGFQKKEVMSMVKEGIKQMFKSKKRKVEKSFATEQKKQEEDSDLDIENFFKDIDSDSDE